MTDTPGPNITLLKWIVITLGILIVVFATIIAVKFYQLMTAEAEVSAEVSKAVAPVPQISATSKIVNFKDFTIPLPAGYRLVQMSVDQGRLYLQIKGEGKPAVILVNDAYTGQSLGQIKLTSAVNQ